MKHLPCSIENCDRNAHNSAGGRRGLCNKHRLQVDRKGAIHISRRDKRPAILEGNIAKIPLGVEAIEGYVVVDKEYAYLANENWYAHKAGYASRGRDDMLMHRLIMDTPFDMVTDHIDGNGLNNRVSNLRVCTNVENVRNAKLASHNRTGYKGVSYEKRSHRYVARIWHFGHIQLGTFDTKEQAALAYNEAAIKYFGEYARLNKLA